MVLGTATSFSKSINVNAQNLNKNQISNTQEDIKTSTNKVNLSSQDSVMVNQEIDLNLSFNLSKDNYYASELIFNYDSEFFELIDISSSNEKIIIKTTQLNDGDLKIIIATRGEALKEGSDILNVKLKALKEGSNKSITLKNNKIANADGNKELIDNTSKNINITTGNIEICKVENLKYENLKYDEVTLSWDNPKSITGLNEFVIYKDGKIYDTVNNETTSIKISDLKSNTLYGFKVTAKYSNDKESKPQSLSVRTKKNSDFNLFKFIFNN